MSRTPLYMADGMTPERITKAAALQWARRLREGVRGFEQAVRDGDVDAMVEWAHECGGSGAQLENIADTTRDVLDDAVDADGYRR